MAKPVPFAHLHLHLEHSPLDGACKPGEVFPRAQELGMESIGITDHGSASGWLKAQRAADKAGMKAILGTEVYFTDDRRVKDAGWKYQHLTLLAENDIGLRNLQKLNHRASTEGTYSGKPRADFELLHEYREGIIVLTGCLASRVQQKLAGLKGDPKSDKQRLANAREEVERLIAAVGKENVFMEMQNVGLEIPGHGNQRQWNREQFAIANDLGLISVGTGDVHYVHERDFDGGYHECMLASQSKKTLDDPKRLSFAPYKYFLRSYEQMKALIDADAPGAVENTLHVVERCNARVQTGRTFELLPKFPLPEGYRPSTGAPDGMDPEEWARQQYLRDRVWQGLHARYGAPLPAEVVERAEYEVTVVNKMGVTSYFLILDDLFQFCAREGIAMGPGRGSGAGSIVLYALEVTDLCPLEHGLLFERFLNPERISMPDVDIDVLVVRRNELFEYMRDKYGADKTSQIITFSRIGSKAGIRRAASAKGKEFLPLADKMAKMIPTKGTVAAPLADAMLTKAELEKMDAKERGKRGSNVSIELQKLVSADPVARWIIDQALWLEGMISAESVHAAACIVAPGPIDDYVPVTTDKRGLNVSAFDMVDAEEVGLLKLDFLGLRNLDVIQDACHNIKVTTGEVVDIRKIPLDDAPTYAMLAKGDSVGVFQFESGGMQDTLRTIGVTEFNDLVAIVAAYRPGAMEQIPLYARRKQGKEAVTYGDPRMEQFLSETQGLILYQEQAMQLSRELAGFTGGKMDELRKAIGKKKLDKMEELKPLFYDGGLVERKREDGEIEQVQVPGVIKNGVPRKTADWIWDVFIASANYSFNKSHAAAYALISYRTAYLKANYPAEYMAALLTSVMDKKDKVPFYTHETKRMGLKVLPPDVNYSGTGFVPTEDRKGVRFGLSAIKNAGEGVVAAIAADRESDGPYKDIYDLCTRVEVGKRDLEFMIKAGALDSMGAPRKGMLEIFEQAVEVARKDRKQRANGQDSLFTDVEDEFAGLAGSMGPAIPAIEFSEDEKFVMEREATGLYVSGHPLDHHIVAWERVRTAGLGQLEDEHIGENINVCGIVTEKVSKYTRRDNKRFLVVTIDDPTGAREVTLWPRTLEDNPDLDRMLTEGSMVTLRCLVKEDDRSFSKQQATPEQEDGTDDAGAVVEEQAKQIKLEIQSVWPFDGATVEAGPLEIRLSSRQLTPQIMQQITEQLHAHPGHTPVTILLETPDGVRAFEQPGMKVERSAALKDKLSALISS